MLIQKKISRGGAAHSGDMQSGSVYGLKGNRGGQNGSERSSAHKRDIFGDADGARAEDCATATPLTPTPRTSSDSVP